MDHHKLQSFQAHLFQNEKSPATIEKYLRDVKSFLRWLGDAPLEKESLIAYKNHLTTSYAARSVNAMLAGINAYLDFIGRAECKVKPLHIQRQFFSGEKQELTRAEYVRLVRAAGRTQIGYVIQAICGTGIRVSELSFITAEAVQSGYAVVRNKGKIRTIFISAPLQRLLLQYMKKSGISAGILFLNKQGQPLSRFSIWRMMKRLCSAAGVAADKTFPHNLRHLFARTFYAMEKDLLRLADLLGHSSIDTTRVYTLDNGQQHMKAAEKVCGLLLTEC